MNPLEQEHRLNVERAKHQRFDRVLWVYGAATSVAFVGFGAFVVATTDWHTTDVFQQIVDRFGPLVLCGLSPLMAFAMIAAGIRVAKWHADRNVLVSTTDRERTYRSPMEPANAVVLSPSTWPRVRGAGFVVLLGLVIVVVDRYGPNIAWSWRASLGAAFTLAVGVVTLTMRAYATWRSRRSARLQLKWDRWLESADSCKVGAREWTE